MSKSLGERSKQWTVVIVYGRTLAPYVFFDYHNIYLLFTAKLNEVCNIINTIIRSDKGLAPTSRQAIIWNKTVCYDIIIKSEKKVISEGLYLQCILRSDAFKHSDLCDVRHENQCVFNWLPPLVWLAKLVSRDRCLFVCISSPFVASFAISHDVITGS